MCYVLVSQRLLSSIRLRDTWNRQVCLFFRPAKLTMTLQRTSAIPSALLLWITLGTVASFPQDWMRLIPAADLASVTSGALQKAPLPAALYQEDLKGCNADKNPGCPLLTPPTDFYKSPENDMIILAYDFDANLGGEAQLIALILSAFERVERDTGCVRFMQPKDVYSGDTKAAMPILTIKRDKTCSASFGGKRNAEEGANIDYPITLNKDCIAGKEGNVQRLLMLAMGFPHEHVRSDRDDYISVNMDNVIPARKSEFDKNPPDVAYLDQYDYESVLHPAYVFSAVDPKVPTIVAKNGAKIGQREQMSRGDAEKIKRLVCEGSKTKPLKTSRPSDDAGAAARPAPATPTKKPPLDPDEDVGNVVKPTVPLPPATPAPKPSFVLPPLTAPQPVPERPGPSPAIAPTGTQKCGKDLYLKVMNSQTWYQTSGDAQLEANWMASQFTTKWFMPPADASDDYLTSTVAFKVNDTVTGDAVPAAVKVLVNDISKRVFRTEFHTQTLSEGGYVLNTKFETVLASCVPLSDLPKKKQKT